MKNVALGAKLCANGTKKQTFFLRYVLLIDFFIKKVED